MNNLQEDLLEIYNNLVELSRIVQDEHNPVPVKVWFDSEGLGSPLVFEAKGTTVRLRLPIYYCLGLEDIKKETYLLPKDYIETMTNLLSIIQDSRILDQRTCLSPENYGFDIYALDYSQFSKGLEKMGKVRFVSGTSFLFKLITKWKYKLK